ncbi:hypothetical protein DK880_00962 [Candidatus Cardinium hertigii]|uniref:Uncharacterized protein n=1 Tax=Candidatus Cardinium hertigii TaxID=247481 RepID=A0A2Z3LA98_9BACT|nr:hypothetical protein DK880_00962 [Candidatus Cardinium hertigii]
MAYLADISGKAKKKEALIASDLRVKIQNRT